MRRRTVFGTVLASTLLVAAGVVTLAAPGTPAGAITNCSVTASQVGLDSEEQQMLSLINAERTSRGLPALKASAALSRAAQWKANDSTASGSTFGHTDSLGRNFDTRIYQCGYMAGSPAGSTLTGEVLAYGYSSPAATLKAWMESPGHKGVILWHYALPGGHQPSVIGLGRNGNRWSVTFGGFDDSGLAWPSTNPPASNPPTATPTSAPAPSQPVAPPPSFSTQLLAGENYLVFTGPAMSTVQAFGGIYDAVAVVYHWNAISRAWERYVPGGPSYLTNFHTLTPGHLYIVVMSRAATWVY
jgi:hypothetical protein